MAVTDYMQKGLCSSLRCIPTNSKLSLLIPVLCSVSLPNRLIRHNTCRSQICCLYNSHYSNSYYMNFPPFALILCNDFSPPPMQLGDYPFEEGLFWKLIVKDSFEHCCPSFQFLKELRIGNFKFRELEFRLLKIIVDNASSLAVVILNTCGNIMRTTEEKTLLEWMSKQNCRFEVSENNNKRRLGTRPRYSQTEEGELKCINGDLFAIE